MWLNCCRVICSLRHVFISVWRLITKSLANNELNTLWSHQCRIRSTNNVNINDVNGWYYVVSVCRSFILQVECRERVQTNCLISLFSRSILSPTVSSLTFSRWVTSWARTCPSVFMQMMWCVIFLQLWNFLVNILFSGFPLKQLQLTAMIYWQCENTVNGSLSWICGSPFYAAL